MTVLVQRPAPTFTALSVVEGQFKDVSLVDYRGQWVLLLFYPLDFTFVCPTEIWAFNDALPQFKALSTSVLAISTDSEHSHLAWSKQPRKQGGLGPDLKLPLLADKRMTIARDYGVLIENEGIALRGMFLIDPKGVLRQMTVNDLPVGRSVDEALRLIKAFQYADKHGEVCPANWKEGAKTMKANPTESLKYFNTVESGVQADANGNKGQATKNGENAAENAEHGEQVDASGRRGWGKRWESEHGKEQPGWGKDKRWEQERSQPAKA